jgi:Tfp pilus assembly protein PilF
VSALAERYFVKALDDIRIKDYEHAILMLQESVKLKPDFVEAWVVRGNCTNSAGRSLDAVLNYEQAIKIDNTKFDAWNNQGIAFSAIGMFEQAEYCFRKSDELYPALEPHMGLANMYCALMRLPEAEAGYRKAIERGAGFDARFNLGITLLGMGRWEEGFREYEARWDNTVYPPRAYSNYPKWHGEPLDGPILLYGEQGYGDEILALRFAKLVQKEHPTAKAIVQSRGPMFRLAQRSLHSAGIDVVPVDVTPEAQYSCPLLDVPMVLGLTWQQAEEQAKLYGQYLSAPTGDWHERLEKLGPGLKVGLCWTSGTHLNTAEAGYKAKSIPWQWLKPLVMPGVTLISLQKPAERTGLPLVDWMEECHDFADTAALIDELDLVISVDTAVAHIAGALGRPVWNFVRSSGYWPWLAPDVVGDPDRAIWYPSMRLFRQPSLANWDQPINRAVDLLQEIVALKEDAA